MLNMYKGRSENLMDILQITQLNSIRNTFNKDSFAMWTIWLLNKVKGNLRKTPYVYYLQCKDNFKNFDTYIHACPYKKNIEKIYKMIGKLTENFQKRLTLYMHGSRKFFQRCVGVWGEGWGGGSNNYLSFPGAEVGFEAYCWQFYNVNLKNF